MSAVRAFQRKLEVFKSDLQEGLLHFPKLLEQTKGDNRPQNHVGFLEKLIENFKTRFDDFRLGKQVLLYIENPFLVRNVREFSAEANKSSHGPVLLLCKRSLRTGLEVCEGGTGLEVSEDWYWSRGLEDWSWSRGLEDWYWSRGLEDWYWSRGL
ncbi:General transcription factor II-I repeat domain containing protein 2 [Dissostichus eleginoides]|uniref:General transcription factor II-I repeat domain containing protein 2 n=1 Tax=Dissostichus eleginoides TaxID=100907 RepID=A0AAD9FJV6_DISEL|nr:General transcription factor II-I repeat domain containing protein 2 [Dissostichus eleginoides]